MALHPVPIGIRVIGFVVDSLLKKDYDGLMISRTQGLVSFSILLPRLLTKLL